MREYLPEIAVTTSIVVFILFAGYMSGLPQSAHFEERCTHYQTHMAVIPSAALPGYQPSSGGLSYVPTSECDRYKSVYVPARRGLWGN